MDEDDDYRLMYGIVVAAPVGVLYSVRQIGPAHQPMNIGCMREAIRGFRVFFNVPAFHFVLVVADV